MLSSLVSCSPSSSSDADLQSQNDNDSPECVNNVHNNIENKFRDKYVQVNLKHKVHRFRSKGT